MSWNNLPCHGEISKCHEVIRHAFELIDLSCHGVIMHIMELWILWSYYAHHGVIMHDMELLVTSWSQLYTEWRPGISYISFKLGNWRSDKALICRSFQTLVCPCYLRSRSQGIRPMQGEKFNLRGRKQHSGSLIKTKFSSSGSRARRK